MTTTWKLHLADFREWIKAYDGPRFHCLINDWPYNLQSIIDRFGKEGSAPTQEGRDGAFARQSAGFMGQAWDTELAFDPQLWRDIKRVMYPGAFVAGFAHPRNADLLASAMREAGYMIGQTIYRVHVPVYLGWIYSTGKPNGTRVNLYLEGAEAETWDGYQYGQPLAPEIEPIIIGQVPYEGKPVQSMLSTGAGALNIAYSKESLFGKFPGHFILEHHPECTSEGYVERKSKKGKVTRSGISAVYRDQTPSIYIPGNKVIPVYNCHPSCPVKRSNLGNERAGYFLQVDWNLETAGRLAGAFPFFYSGKVSTEEREAGCEHLETKVRRRVNPGGLEKEKRFAPVERKNHHPTLKPISLCRWISGLLCPPAKYNPRLLIPTLGTGSEAIGAIHAGGWSEIEGCEIEPDYYQITQARLNYYANRAEKFKALSNSQLALFS